MYNITPKIKMSQSLSLNNNLYHQTSHLTEQKSSIVQVLCHWGKLVKSVSHPVLPHEAQGTQIT